MGPGARPDEFIRTAAPEEGVDDPGWRRGMHRMALVAVAAGVAFLTFSLAHQPKLAFLAPFLVVAGVGAALRAHARARQWSEYGRGLRDGFWGGLLLFVGFFGLMLVLAGPWL